MILWKKKRIELGEGHIEQLTIFESKYLGGVWIYDWHTIKQNRFHTHAFNSIAILLSGKYFEEVIVNGVIKQNTVDNKFKLRFLPRNYCHRILAADEHTKTIVFFGRWIPHWWEFFKDSHTWVKYAWGRKVVKKVSGDETKINEILIWSDDDY